MINEISTKRLIMRRFNKNDADDVYEYLGDEDVMQYIEPSFNYEQTVEFIDLFICVDPAVYALVEKISGKVIGHIIFHSYKHDLVYEIGWILNKNFQGKGYAFEVSNELIKYGFEELKGIGIIKL